MIKAQYGHTRKFNKKIDELLSQQTKPKKESTFTGLLARKNTPMPKDMNTEDPMKRIANFVSVIRKRRMELKNADE